ncbi:hypothetical protein Tco_0657530, partial [Tanacetum coccineum]
MMSSPSTIKLTDTILEVPVRKPRTQPTSSVIDITPPKQPKIPPVAPRADRGKGIAIDYIKPLIKLIKASSEVRPDPDEPIRIPYDTHGKLYHLTNDEIKEHLDREENMKKSIEEAKLLAISKLELIKVVAEVKFLIREHFQKVKREMKLKKKRFDPYMWTTTSRLKPEPITDVKIHDNTKPVVLTVYRGTNRRNFKVHNSFKFGDFRITELDELGPIIEKKKNKIVGKLMISLGKIYERLNKNPEELGIQSALPTPLQAQSQSSRRKRKHMEMEPEIRIPGLECNRSLPEGVLFVNNMVIEEPEYGMFFIDVFSDKAFQRINDMHKVDIETLLTYLVMASNINTLENHRFCLKLRDLIGKHPDQEKLKSNRVKLEALGYK